MRRVGIVDLGSNTARLVVYEHEPGRWYRLVDEIRAPVRLGQGLAASGRLEGAAMDRALAALRLYSDYAAATGLDAVEIVATSAVRDAANRDDLLTEIRRLGHPVTVLSGLEEAEVGVIAVANSFALEDAWVADLGGGSAQVSQLRRRRPQRCRSFPLGNLRLSELYLHSDPPTAAEVATMEEALARQLGDTGDAMRTEPAPLVAMGGTIRNLAAAVQKRTEYPFDLLHGYHLDGDLFRRLVGHLLAVKAAQRAEIPGIHPDRADVITAGAVVFRWLLDASGRDGIHIAGQGIREGIFYRHALPPPHLIADVRRFAVDNLAHRYPQPNDHIHGVRRLAGRLFEGLRALHQLDGPEAELLDAAAVLHDIGATVNYYDHHRHGEYLLTAGPLPGFSHREQALLGLLIRYHRKGMPKSRGYKALLAGSDKHRLRVLTACLRLAEAFERSRAGRVQDLMIELGGDAVTVTLIAEEPPQVELWEARKQAALFERAFDRGLRLEAVVTAGRTGAID